tara:strand:- start:4312 stop:4554 length:243 start_codon:yes stop_codon:yes gene_type:complete
MVIIICFGANCQSIWEEHWYTTLEDCLQQTPAVKEYMMNTFPTSAGEIYCMNEQEFGKYYQRLLEDGTPNSKLPDASGKI